MEIIFTSKKLEKIFNTESLLRKEYGKQAAAIMNRMAVLRAAPSLADVPTQPPERRHQLSGDFSGCFALDLKHPYRLILKPAECPIPKKEDGGIDLEAVKMICIMDVVDYH